MSLLDEVPGDGPKKVAILGSTGSIGRQALDVVRTHPDRFEVVALAAGSDGKTLLAQSEEFAVSMIGLASGSVSAAKGVSIFEGEDAAQRVAEEADAQVVLNAVMGAAGLRATLATIISGKALALANKESLVAAGELVMARAGPGQIRPIDSEHSALWQVLEGVSPDHVRRVWLTGSGGPFRGRGTEDLREATVQQALAHPVWEMGPKITVDSATLMNKGLEVIEAHFLFGLIYDEIEVVIHPQGLVHALVETTDGAVYAQAALPDMRLPIQIALAWPDRLAPPNGNRIDFRAGVEATFEAPDTDTFRCLALAYEAGRRGDSYPAVLNAANEVAVQSFIDERLDLLGIAAIVERVLEEHEPVEATLDGVLEQDAWARTRAQDLIGAMEVKR